MHCTPANCTSSIRYFVVNVGRWKERERERGAEMFFQRKKNIKVRNRALRKRRTELSDGNAMSQYPRAQVLFRAATVIELRGTMRFRLLLAARGVPEPVASRLIATKRFVGRIDGNGSRQHRTLCTKLLPRDHMISRVIARPLCPDSTPHRPGPPVLPTPPICAC